STPPAEAPSTPPAEAPSTPPAEAPSTPPAEAPSTPSTGTPSPPSTQTVPTPSPEESQTPPQEKPAPNQGAQETPAEEAPKPPEDPLATRIGFFAPMSGAQSSFGLDAVNGAKLAVDEINLAGGVLGHPLQLVIKDTESESERTNAVVTELIKTDKVAALVGEITTDRTLIAASVAQASGIPMITPSATGEKVTEAGDSIFRACYTDAFQAAIMAKFARSIDVEKAAILFDASSPYGSSLMEAFKADFVRHGGTIVAEEFYRSGDTDFAAQLNAIKEKNPDSIFLPCYYTEAALIIRQARQLGIDVPFLGTDGWDSPEFLKVGAQAVNNCYFASHFSSEHVSEKAKAFKEAYRAKFQAAPPPLAALTYDSVWLVADALKRSGTAESAALRAAIAATRDFPGVTGSISFDPGRDPKKPGVVIRVQDGQFTYLETAEP
ncbi:MAG: ABC transporter substrate-binding protein, partial [Terrimicrobiaceae bacterium]